MNKIYVDIDFTNGILEKKGIDLITGDYASTEIEFTFDESHSTGRKVFEMKSPSNELVIVKEIEDNKVLLASKDENQNNVSLFNESGYYIFEVSYYDNDSKLTSVYGKIPVEQEQVVIDGEVVTPYLPIFDQLIQDLNNKIDEVDTKLEEVDTKLDNIDTALEEVNAAIEETNNLDINVSDKSNKEVTITLTKKDNTTKSVKINDGVSLQFMWQGTSLGIKTDDMQDYVFVNLQGIQGLPGPQGEPFRIKKTYPSVQAMQDDFNNMQYGDYVMIASSVEVEDNAKLYTRGESQWIFITDFSGATGIRGPVGATPNIQIGNVTSGSTPSVTRTGTDENPILNFVLEKGEKGDKPVKGVDYFTAQDKQEIVSEVTEDATSTFNQNVIAKTNEFNANATQKTTQFNENATQKTTEFNTNAQEKTDEFNANKEKLQQELERYKMLENALPHVSGSGESVTLDNTANASMTIDLEPNTSQETTTGKNLLPSAPAGSTSDKGITFTSNGDGSYTIVGTATESVYLSLNLSKTVDLPNETLYVHLRNNIVNSDVTFNIIGNKTIQPGFSVTNRIMTSVNLTNNTGVYRVGCYVKGGEVVNATIQPSIELTDSVTDYEPYTNGASPNPEFPQDIHVVSGDNEVVVGNKNKLSEIYQNSKPGVTVSADKQTVVVDFTTSNDMYFMIKKLINDNPTTKAYTVYFEASGLASGETPKYNLWGGGTLFTLKNGKNVATIPSGTTLNQDNIIFDDQQRTLYPVGSVVTFTNFMIVEGEYTEETIGDYEPHEEQVVNIPLGDLEYCKMPNTNYKDEFVIPSKKNKININGNIVKREVAAYSNIKVSGDTLSYNTTSATAGYLGFIVPVTIGQIYTLSWGALTGDIRYVELDEIISSINTEYGNHISNGSTITPSKPYLGIWLQIGGNSSASVSKLQLEEGTTALPYEPYNDGKWYLKKNIGKVVLDGSESWTKSATYQGSFWAYVLKTKPAIAYSLLYCTHFKRANINNSSQIPTNYFEGTCFCESDHIFDCWFDDGSSTIQQFENWLEENNVELYYILETPTYTLLNDTLQNALNTLESKLLAYKDQTNISQTNDDLPFEIVASALKDISNL